jgi:predicted phosphodiesterase
VQIGDLGFADAWAYCTDKYADRLRVVAGNHDDYDWIEANKPSIYLGDYGPIPEIPDSFFVRGAQSTDIARRTAGVDYWPQEELSHAQMRAAISDYVAARPKIVFTHDAPAMIVDHLHRAHYSKSSRTQQLLQMMFEVHKPNIWLHGHHHLSRMQGFSSTWFVSLGIGEVRTVVAAESTVALERCDGD